MTAVKTLAADGVSWHIAITEGTVSFDSGIWDALDDGYAPSGWLGLDELYDGSEDTDEDEDDERDAHAQFKAAVTSVSIPGTVTTIGSEAFNGCTAITSMILPDSVTTIGNYAFYGCTAITSMIVPDSVTTIGNYAFRGCSSITSMILPDSVTTIGDGAFDGCTSITSMVLPESVTTLGMSAFSGCSSIISVIVPESVTRIGNWTFQGCSSMTSIVLPESVTTLGDWAFSGCTSLTSMVLPESVTTIDDFAFVACTSLATLIVFRPPPPPPPAVADSGPAPARLTVHPCAFECPNLKRVSAPDEVVAALDEPYEACATLAALPAAVTRNAFKLQIETYFWSMKLHRNTNRLSARQRAWVKHLLTVGSRARLHWRPVGKGPRSEPCLPAPNHPPLPCIPNDVWLHVLLFVKLSEMRAV